MQEGVRRGTTFLYPIHEELPDFVYGAEDINDETRHQLEEIFGLRYYGGFPMLLYYELLHSAVAARRQHRYVPAVAALGTTLEVLVSSVIRMVGSGPDHDQDAVERALRATLRNQVVDHLPQYVNAAVDLADAANPFGRWWLGGYRLRNAVIHEGHRPTEAEVDDAFDDAQAFVDAVADGMATIEQEGPGRRTLWPFRAPEEG